MHSLLYMYFTSFFVLKHPISKLQQHIIHASFYSIVNYIQRPTYFLFRVWSKIFRNNLIHEHVSSAMGFILGYIYCVYSAMVKKKHYTRTKTCYIHSVVPIIFEGVLFHFIMFIEDLITSRQLPHTRKQRYYVNIRLLAW